MKINAVSVLLLSIVSTLAACGASGRSATTVARDGTVTCAQPPADVVRTGLSANIEALVPRIRADIDANASAGTTVQRIREEIPNLQAVEALEYRMCLAFANGALTQEGYSRFVESILPLLRGMPAGDAAPETESETEIEVRRSYSGVTNCNEARSRETAIQACGVEAREFAAQNRLTFVSSRLVDFSDDIRHEREPWPSNARSCRAEVRARCAVTTRAD